MRNKRHEAGDADDPTKDVADARRVQVLGAARRCVGEHGFHAATVQMIARAAGMSPGHIYRYFRNKEAIVEGLVEHRLAERSMDTTRITALCHARGIPDAWIAQLDASIAARGRARRTGLDLEILAESSRNDAVAQQVHRADLATRAGVMEALKSLPAMGRLPLCELSARLAVMNLLLEGLTLRSMCDSSMDRMAVRRIMERVVRMLLDEAG